MNVARILSAKGGDVFTLKPGVSMMEAISALREYKVGALVVSSGNGAIDGILSERDVVRAIDKDGAKALDEPVSTYMTAKVVSCSEDTTVHELMERMTEGRFRHMPVGRDGKLAGIISIGDVVKARIAEIEHEADEIRSYIAQV